MGRGGRRIDPRRAKHEWRHPIAGEFSRRGRCRLWPPLRTGLALFSAQMACALHGGVQIAQRILARTGSNVSVRPFLHFGVLGEVRRDHAGLRQSLQCGHAAGGVLGAVGFVNGSAPDRVHEAIPRLDLGECVHHAAPSARSVTTFPPSPATREQNPHQSAISLRRFSSTSPRRYAASTFNSIVCASAASTTSR